MMFDKFSKPNKKLHNIWTKEEIEKIVNNLSDNTDTETRDKAIALLAIRLGIRFIDIKNLKFDNINWAENKICFTQSKTNKYVELPLPEQVGLAIINYIKNARPKSKTKYIFITHDYYHEKLSDSFNIHKYLIDAYEKANVEYLNKDRKGIHLFRHTLASNMLENGIPLDIISSTLGHANSDSSKDYLMISNNLLEKCCLDIPEVVK
mgnify:CR=1 FL=1